MGQAATRAIAALVAAQVPYQVLRYQPNQRRHGFGAEAVEQLAAADSASGLRAEQVFKTLVVAVPRGLA
ncbi:MAG TPA: Cys-tRNA(Pro) deacylase, partial [Mycobacterium sp.]|nr:Cys-tRNA(Pro) deacylase [Mycobacterium sp.]